MKMIKVISLVLSSLLLVACGDEETSTVDFSGWEKSYLVYSFPFDQQEQVATKSNIVLSFTHPVEDNDMQNHVQVFNQDDQVITGIVRQQDDAPETLLFIPTAELSPGEQYRIDYTGVITEFGEVEEVRSIEFTTLADRDNEAIIAPGDGSPGAPGNPDDPVYNPGFRVVSAFPTADLPFMDFSSLRLNFSHQIDPKSVVLNESFSFSKQGENTSIRGDILVKGRSLSFDPAEDLEAGTTYVLALTSEIKSLSGLSLIESEYSEKLYLPQSSLPRTTLVQKISDSNNGTILSPLSGEPINSVPIKSILLGEADRTFVEGDMHAELAFIPNFPDASPLVIRKGTVMQGSEIAVNIGGNIPAGFTTGAIKMTLVADGHGYLINNSSTSDKNAPKQIRLMLDVAMTAEGQKANAALSQDILQLELFGWAKTINEVMVIDAVGHVSPKLLGLEDASGTVSFHLEAYKDQKNAPEKALDELEPSLQSWVPGEYASYMNLSEPLLLTFDEPLDNSTLSAGIQLLLNGQGQDIRVRQDGSVLVVQPQTSLLPGSDYQLSLNELVKDIAGNAITPLDLRFTTPSINTATKAAALIESAYPGYNCLMTGANVSANIAGRCAEGKGSDDVFSIFELPANRSIAVTFNQPMKQSSLILGNECGAGTVQVEELDDNGNCIAAVAGTLKTTASTIDFTPSRMWQDDKNYRYSLVSASSGNCSGNSIICSQLDLPLNTNPLKITSENRTAGDSTFSVLFKAAAVEASYVMNPLAKIPTADTNKNFAQDESETFMTKNSAHLTIASYEGAVINANMGCLPENEPCEDKKSIFVSGLLPTDVGTWDEANQRIEVKIYPQALMSTSALMYAHLSLDLGLFPIDLGWKEEPTGPQIMRIRYNRDQQGKMVPPVGYITENDAGQATFTTELNLYLDAPELNPMGLGTNLHSLPLTMKLSGPVTFMDDGRMEVQLSNTEVVNINVEIGGSLAKVFLEIQQGDLSLNLVSRLIK